MLVKDKANILTHNQWTCGDYLNNVTDFKFIGISSQAISLDNTNPTNGKVCLKIERTDNNGYSFIIIPYQITSDDLGKTLTITAYIKNNIPAGVIALQISGATAVRTYIPNISEGTFTVTRVLESDDLQMQITTNGFGEIYLDNIIATFQ